jgi:hypothetical protein
MADVAQALDREIRGSPSSRQFVRADCAFRVSVFRKLTGRQNGGKNDGC